MKTRKSTGLAESEGVKRAFEALKTFDWGADRKLLVPLEEAVVASLDDAEARAALEARLVAVLEADAPRAAKDVVCRQLRKLGTAACVPALARLLADRELSHLARFALERIQDPAAAAALREALPKVRGELQARESVARIP